MEPSPELAEASGPLGGPAQLLAAGLDAEADARFAADETVRIVFPERGDDPRFREAILRSSVDKIDAMWRVIAGRDALSASAPVAAFTFAETAAEAGVPVTQFERAYRVGIGLVWLSWYRHALEHAARSRVPVADLIGPPTMIIHAYVDGVLSPLVERFVSTKAEHGTSRAHLRRSVLRELLSGTALPDPAVAEDALGLALDADHVAFVVHAASHCDGDDVAAYVVPACGMGATALTHRQDNDTWIVWLSAPDGFATTRLARLREALEHTGLRIGLGEPAAGLPGMASTARGALEAARLQRMIGPGVPSVMSFSDVRLEALFLADPERAQRFVRDELGALDAPDVGMRRLRDTALTWLQTGSHVGTAAGLGLHEHTVRRRITQAEELLGGPLADRRTELLVALRLRRVLDGSRQASGAAWTDCANKRGQR